MILMMVVLGDDTDDGSDKEVVLGDDADDGSVG